MSNLSKLNTSTLSEIEGFFSPVYAGVQGLADRRNLLLEKYYQEAPVWSLLFRHPKGGVAKIDLLKTNQGRVALSAVWWINDFEASTRYMKWFEEVIVEKECEAIVTGISVLLDRVLAHPYGDWSKAVDGFKPLWESSGRDSVEGEERRYPLPVLGRTDGQAEDGGLDL